MMLDTRHTLLALAALCSTGCDPAAEPEQGFAGLGAEVEGFAPVSPNVPLRFPVDHASHPDYRIEWWYVTANLEDERGRAWGVQWTLFRQALEPQTPAEAAAGWRSAQVWLGHAAVTRADAHRFADRLARGGIGQAGVSTDPFQAWIDHWSLDAVPDSSGSDSSASDPFNALRVTASGDDFSYALQLRSERPLVLHGDQGYSRKSAGEQASYYYSQPFYQAEGTIEWEGEQIPVTGQAWLDREWSSQPLAGDQRGWDWFSLHLDGGQKLMLFRLRSAEDQAFVSGSWVSADGKVTALDGGQITMQERAQTRVAGRKVPTSWRLQVPFRNLDIEVQALNAQSWMGTSIPYWEGPVRITGNRQGMGYLEMTGY